MTDELGRGADPIPASWKLADPERARRAKEIEGHLEAWLNPEYEHGPPAWGGIYERMHDLHDCSDETWGSLRGHVYLAGGAWFFQKHLTLSPQMEHLDLPQAPAVELDVDNERDAKQHGRRRVAWELAK
jgi:hypothetical protein